MKLTLCLFLACFGLYAQNEPADVPPPASREEVEEAVKKATKDLKGSLREADKKAAERSAAEMDSARAIGKDLEESVKTATEKLQEGMARQAEENRKSAEALAKATNQRILMFAGVIFGVFVTSGVIVYFRRRRKETQILVTAETPKLEPEHQPEVLHNPEQPDLRAYVLRTGNVNIPTCYSIRDIGTGIEIQELCTTKYREGQDPLLHFPGREKPVTWEKRKKFLSGLARERQHQSEVAS